MDVKTVRVKSQKELDCKVEDMKDEGWIVDTHGAKEAVMKHTGGVGRKRWHALLLVATVWWAWLIPNICYALFSYFINVKKTIIRIG